MLFFAFDIFPFSMLMKEKTLTNPRRQSVQASQNERRQGHDSVILA